MLTSSGRLRQSGRHQSAEIVPSRNEQITSRKQESQFKSWELDSYFVAAWRLRRLYVEYKDTVRSN